MSAVRSSIEASTLELPQPANLLNTLVASGAQCLQAGSISAWSWGLRSALISVGGQIGGIAGPLASTYFMAPDPTLTMQTPPPLCEDVPGQAELIGTMCGKLIGVCAGTVVLGPAQALAENLCIGLRRWVGNGTQYNVPPQQDPSWHQRLTERLFCAGALIRPPIEHPLLGQPPNPAPSAMNMTEVASLDLLSSGMTTTLVQTVVCISDWNRNGGDKGELIPVRPVLNNDIALLKRGAKTVAAGAAFDLIPGLLQIMAPHLPSALVETARPILNTVAPVAGTVFRLDTWFAGAPKTSPAIEDMDMIEAFKTEQEKEAAKDAAFEASLERTPQADATDSNDNTIVIIPEIDIALIVPETDIAL